MTPEQRRGDHAAHYRRYRAYYIAKAKKRAVGKPRDPAALAAYAREYRLMNVEKRRAARRAYYEKNKVRMLACQKRRYEATKPQRLAEMREATYRRKYGITVAEYDEMLALQGGVCAICGSKPGQKRHAVDHDHRTGAVRGLLCHTCNKVLGAFGDDSMKFARAIAYLESAAGRSKES